MTVEEMQNVQSRKGKLTITVKEQKDIHIAHIAVEQELKELRKTSDLGWRFCAKTKPDPKGVAFSSVSDKNRREEKMTSSNFNLSQESHKHHQSEKAHTNAVSQ